MKLEEFLCGIEAAFFFNEKWGKEPFYFPKSAFSLRSPEKLLASLLELPRLRYPQVRVLNGAGALNPLLYTESSRYKLSESISKDKVLFLAKAPNTIKIEDLASLDPVFEQWANHLRNIFSSEITLNGYFSFGPGDGIPTHYDSHHIFALQLYGEKTWSLGGSQAEFFPHKDLAISSNIESGQTVEHQLKAGEMLYVPLGRLHSLHTEQQSVHITAGIHTPRCFQAISSLLQKASMNHTELRADMPFSVSSEGLKFQSLSREELEIALSLIKYEYDNCSA